MKRKQADTIPAASQEAVITGGEKSMTKREKASSFFANLKKPKVMISLIAVILIVAMVGGGIYLKSWLEGRQVVLTVGDYSYTQTQYNELVSHAAELGIGKQEARAALVDALAARAAADKLELPYLSDQTSQENAARILYNIKLDSPVSDYQRATSWSTAIQPHVAVSALGGYRVAVVYFPFSRYITGFHESYLTRTFDLKQVGNKSAIKGDIAYAKKQVDASIADYSSKSKSMSEIIAQVLSDPRLASYGQTANKSGIVFVGLDHQSYGIDGAKSLRSAFYANVEKVARATGKPEVFEDTIYQPSGLNMPEVDRADGDTRTAYYFLVVEPIAQKAGIVSQYQKLSKEYSDGAQ